MQTIKKMEAEVEGLLEREELYWKQRSQTNWLEVGDRNSKYFHAQATSRRKKNFIEKLTDSRGIIQSGEARIASVIQEYFSTIFNSSSPSAEDINRATAGISRKLSDDQKSILSKAFSAEEVKEAVFDMNPTKAPGPDRFHAVFFQKFWNIIGADFTRVCLKVLNMEVSIREFNYTNIALILKVHNPISPKDFYCMYIFDQKTRHQLV